MREPKGPLFPFYGAKWTLACKLGPSQRDTIIEPFAGSACYATFCNARRVILIDKDEVICGIWDYLIHASAAEIMSIPVDIDHVDDAAACQEAKWLLGYWFSPGSAKPSKRRANWARTGAAPNVWGVPMRARIARDVEKIRHWRIIHGSYEQAPDITAHWHVDPPYSGGAGRSYRFNNAEIDYAALADWCLSRRGFLQVCEAAGASWLPFRPFDVTGGGRLGPHRPRFSREWLFEQGQRRTSLPRVVSGVILNAQVRPL